MANSCSWIDEKALIRMEMIMTIRSSGGELRPRFSGRHYGMQQISEVGDLEVDARHGKGKWGKLSSLLPGTNTISLTSFTEVRDHTSPPASIGSASSTTTSIC